MLEIIAFYILLFLAVTGLAGILILIFLKISAPYEKKDFFVFGFCDGKDKEYVLWLKWLMTVFAFLGIEERVSFFTVDTGMDERDRHELSLVFSGKKNVFIVDECKNDKNEEKSGY